MMRELMMRERGQSLAEFAVSLPVLILLVGGIVIACFYGFRSAAVDWAVFVHGLAAGSYDEAQAKAHSSVVWSDLTSHIYTSADTDTQSARSWIQIEFRRPLLLGADLIEAYRAQTTFRFWRFYPGPR